MKERVTVICQEDGYQDILIYTIEVDDPEDYDKVQAAVQKERDADLGVDAGEMEPLFTFQGDLYPRSDWR